MSKNATNYYHLIKLTFFCNYKLYIYELNEGINFKKTIYIYQRCVFIIHHMHYENTFCANIAKLDSIFFLSEDSIFMIHHMHYENTFCDTL